MYCFMTDQKLVDLHEQRISILEDREQPALDTILQLKHRINSMSDQMFTLNKQKLDAKALAKQK